MKIHFMAFIGIEYDMDIMPYWTRYYLDRKFDTYKAFLHRESGMISPDIADRFRRIGFSVELHDGPYGHGLLQKLVFDNYVRKLPPGDFVVVADGDEFQSCSGQSVPAPIDYRTLLTSHDIVCGFMVDRYADRLEDCRMDPFVQYPHEEHFTGEILKAFHPPYLAVSEWPYTRRTKILAARAGDRVAYEGSHCMISVPVNVRLAEGYRVYHFAWREASKRKLVKKCYYTQTTCREVLGNEATEEVLGSRVVAERIMR